MRLNRTYSDAAKKEFSINRALELRLIREKYKDVLTEDGSGNLIRPKFFMHILRASGKGDYLKNGNKSYLRHETSMDYLQELSWGYYRPDSKLKETLPFGSLLNKEHFAENCVYKPSIEKTFNTVNEYLNKVFGINTAPTLEKDQKVMLTIYAKEERNDILDRIKYSYSTMYKLLWMTDKETTKGFSNTLILSLFEMRNTAFYNAIVRSEEPISHLINDDNGDMTLYGYRFRKTYT